MVFIRDVTVSDVPAITAIENEAILTTTATLEIEPKTREEQLAWFNSHGKRHPILVPENDEQVFAWASLSRYSLRYAYVNTAELSVYIKLSPGKRGLENN